MKRRIELATIPAGSRIRAGAPAERPQEALDALLKLFARNRNVICARLGLMEIQYPDGSSEFSYAIGIECSENDVTVAQMAMDTILSVPAARWPISIVPTKAPYLSKDAIVFYVGDQPQKPASKLLRKLGLKI